jgi:HSP90 family molecular chaperone
MFPEKRDLVLNSDHPLIDRLKQKINGESGDEVLKVCQHIVDLARLNHGSLDAEGLKRFLKTHSEWMLKITDEMK